MNLTIPQVKRLAEYFLDVSKGLGLAFFATPVYASNQNTLEAVKTLALSLLFLGFSLKLYEIQKELI